jgi:hypothetical protein
MIAFWFIGIGATIGISIYSKSQEGVEYEAVAFPYIEKVVKEISLWDTGKAKQLMAPEVLATIPDDKFDRAMDFFSQLGALKSMDEPDFKKAFIDQKTEIGTHTIIEYDIDAIYEKGEAEINLKLLDRNGAYEVYRFNFSAEALMPEEEKEKS